MNRDRYLIYVLIAGVIFLVFYWTESYFSNAALNADSELASVTDKTDKALSLFAKSMRPKNDKAPVTTGLLSFIEDTAKAIGLSERLGDIKPNDNGGGEGASFHLDSLTNNEVMEFIRLMESHSNVRVTNVKISKRFDNEKRLNLYMEAQKI